MPKKIVKTKKNVISEKKSDIGLIGLGVMGANIARNIESKGFSVSVYNRNSKVTKKFINKYNKKKLFGFDDYKSFIDSLKNNKKIFIMVTAGAPVDYVINDISKYLSKGDVIIDGGNSFYKDTQRRFESLKKQGIHFLGTGVSGGQEGALHGPSIMPGGSKQGYNKVKNILQNIAAKDFDDKPCVTYIGNNAAGHYVKMVHNGIEYGVMQILAEAYHVLSKNYNLSSPQIAKIFNKYTNSRLSSFLLDISVEVLNKKDQGESRQRWERGHSGVKNHKDQYLINKILDKASQKGTGKWASLDALDRGVAIPTITQAVYARYISGEKDNRKKLNKLYLPEDRHRKNNKKIKPKIKLKKFELLLERALYASLLSIFSQGYDLMVKASEQEKWNLNLAEISRIWEGGCIIRADMLNELHFGYSRNNKKTKNKNNNKHVLELDFARKEFSKDLEALRMFAGVVSQEQIPVPGFASSLFYVESMIEKCLPANMIQGLRDYFGAHTYERIDMKGSFHTDWK